jgi:hypothetical protein
LIIAPGVKAAGKPDVSTSRKESSVQPSETIVPDQAAGQADGQDKVPGVLRLLAEGHFKPVADIRLRINFYDELSQQSENGAAGNVTTLNETLKSDLMAAIDSGVGSDEELRNLLAGVVGELEAALPAGQIGSGEFLETAEKGINEFLAVVADSLAASQQSQADEVPPAEVPETQVVSQDEPTETPPAAEEVPGEAPTPGADLTTLLHDLTRQYLEQLSTIVSDATLAVEPATNVHGKAYEKFLAIYQGMIGQQAETQSTADELEPSLDTVA